MSRNLVRAPVECSAAGQTARIEKEVKAFSRARSFRYMEVVKVSLPLA
ncbi:MAG: hypothetical protein IIC99_03025 [Chloroflexi bacterium]|nr:hypothetical protein [Chloroflexota bacterium]